MTVENDESPGRIEGLSSETAQIWLEQLRWNAQLILDRSHWPRNMAIGLLAFQGTFIATAIQSGFESDATNKIYAGLAGSLLLLAAMLALAALYPREYLAPDLNNHRRTWIEDSKARASGKYTGEKCDAAVRKTLIDEYLLIKAQSGEPPELPLTKLNKITDLRTKFVTSSGVLSLVGLAALLAVSAL